MSKQLLVLSGLATGIFQDRSGHVSTGKRIRTTELRKGATKHEEDSQLNSCRAGDI
jgi:hypothetical protein